MQKKSLQINNSRLASEWHPTKNGKLTPSDVIAGSYKKAWWICSHGSDHEWQATIASRNRGAGCPFCSGRNATELNNLAVKHPELAKQWNTARNGDLSPYDVKPGSDKKVWWKCNEGNDHEWQASIYNRSKGTDCPICAGKKVVKSNSLNSLNPKLSMQWHPEKNGELTPNDVTARTSKRVWWKCEQGNDHEWKASISDRNNGGGCPYCLGRRASKLNNLTVSHSKLAKQWHPSRNGGLSPQDVTAGSGKKVWWSCTENSEHEWHTSIHNRTRGSGCPYCSGRRASKSNNLAEVNPKLAKEWHPTKNKGLKPCEVLPSTKKMIWWQCADNPNHEWKAKLNNRSKGNGCPICCNQKLIKENSLGSVNPALAKQWHTLKNGKLTPFDVAPSANRKVWWKCPKGDDHIWKATVNHRSTGTGCPKCNPAWSVPELRIYTELKTIFPSIQHRAIIRGHEIDIYIPELNIGIEYDGVYWHRDKLKKDRAKNKDLNSSILLIRIREDDLPLLSLTDISIESGKLSVSTIKRILNIILEKRELSTLTVSQIQRYIVIKAWVGSELFDKLYSERKSVRIEESFYHLYPKLSQQWHPSKNNALLPEQFTPGSGRKIWWLAPCGHEWKDTINHRTRGRDCPKCRYKKASRTWRIKRNEGQLKLFK